MLLGSGLAVGLGVLAFRPDMGWYRGLSGVDSGQFAAAVVVEMVRARGFRELALVVPAALVFAVKIAYECATGTMMFGTEGLGYLGTPLATAHVAGTVGAVA